MKKTIGLLITLSLLSGLVYAETDQNKWAGFRGLKWGTNIKDVDDPNMILVEDAKEAKYYRRLNDKLSIGDAKLENVAYEFYKDRFSSVIIKAKGYTNFTALKDAVFAYYGEGKQTNEFIKAWMWSSVFGNSNKDVGMRLDYNEFSEETVVLMFYMPIVQEREADDAKKAKEAGKDF
jgi:hypothetical protein